MKTPFINNLLNNTNDAIEEADKDLEAGMSEALDDEMAGAVDSSVNTDSPLPISNPEWKAFGVKPEWKEQAPKSPEDMEKEYISEAEKTIEECNSRHDEHNAEISELEGKIAVLNAGKLSIDRVIAGKNAFLKEVSAKPKPTTSKKPGAK